VKALRTIAAAVALRTPRIGVRVSRSVVRAWRPSAPAATCALLCGTGGAFDIVTADDAGDPGRLDEGQIDPELFRELPHGRRRPRPLVTHVERRSAVDDVVRSRVEHGGVGCRGARSPACADRRGASSHGTSLRPPGGARRRTVPDEVRDRALRLRGILGNGAAGRGDRVCSSPARRRRGLVAGHRDHDERAADRDDVSRRGVQGLHGAGEGRRQLDDRLGRLDLGDRLIEGDLVTLGDEPLHDLCLGQPLTEVGQAELRVHSATSERLFGRSTTRSTASRMPSRSGTWCFSSFAGG
jgi:hypothetical protein